MTGFFLFLCWVKEQLKDAEKWCSKKKIYEEIRGNIIHLSRAVDGVDQAYIYSFWNDQYDEAVDSVIENFRAKWNQDNLYFSLQR